MMAERGIAVSHTTIMRWVLRYVPEYEVRWARFARSPGSSWRMDETAVNVRGGRYYLYRAVDRQGKSVASFLGEEDARWRTVEIRSNRYLNNVVEQDHRAIKRRCASMLGLKSFCSAAITLAGVELAHRIRKGQYSLQRRHDERSSSLKELWDAALTQEEETPSVCSDSSPPMHQISKAREPHGSAPGNDPETILLKPVRYPRKISFGGNLSMLLMPKGGRYWHYSYRYERQTKDAVSGYVP